MKWLPMVSVLMCAVMLCSCKTVPYELKEEDKLTDKEKYHLFDYSRHFIINSLQNQDINRKKEKKEPVLTSDLRELLLTKDPDVRVHYTAPKTGKISLSWLIPGKLQVIAAAEGRLDLSSGKKADWKLRIITFSRNCPILPEELGIPAVD